MNKSNPQPSGVPNCATSHKNAVKVEIDDDSDVAAHDDSPAIQAAIDEASKLPGLCIMCGKGTPQTIVPPNSTYAMGNVVAPNWRDPHRWSAKQCDCCGNVTFYLDAKE